MTVSSYGLTIDMNREIPYNINVGCILTALFSTTSCMPLRGVAPQIARDEARHGKGFQGLLDRYFGK